MNIIATCGDDIGSKNLLFKEFRKFIMIKIDLFFRESEKSEYKIRKPFSETEILASAFIFYKTVRKKILTTLKRDFGISSNPSWNLANTREEIKNKIVAENIFIPFAPERIKGTYNFIYNFISFFIKKNNNM